MQAAACYTRFSEHDEGLSDVTLDSLLLDSDDVEADGLGERSALADSDDITNSGTGEGRRQMSGHVVMSLLESVVLLDVMEVISSQDNSLVHFVGQDDTLEDSSSDADIGGEWALFVNVRSLNGGLRGLESKTDFLIESGSGGGLLGDDFLGVHEDSKLLLESSFGLNVSHVLLCSRQD